METLEKGNLDYLLFHMDSINLAEKGNAELAISILAPIINPVYGNTVTKSVYTDAVCFLFNRDDSPLLKHSSSVDVSKTNNQSAVIHKVIIHEFVNSFVTR